MGTSTFEDFSSVLDVATADGVVAMLFAVLLLVSTTAYILYVVLAKPFKQSKLSGMIVALLSGSLAEQIALLIFYLLPQSPPLLSQFLNWSGILLTAGAYIVELEVLLRFCPLSRWISASRVRLAQLAVAVGQFLFFTPGYIVFIYRASGWPIGWLENSYYLTLIAGIALISVADTIQSIFIWNLLRAFINRRNAKALEEEETEKVVAQNTKIKYYLFYLFLTAIVDWFGILIFVLPSTSTPANYIGAMMVNVHILTIGFGFRYLVQVTFSPTSAPSSDRVKDKERRTPLKPDPKHEIPVTSLSAANRDTILVK
ncbi:hypothetical protein HDU91_005952 [Kappamyces sp. JEL0680]|nr:hypothetical protein HDU91_005952 [Kappamyces sp. JEL0680]